MNKKQITHWLKVAVIGIVLGFALQFVRAWTEPSVAPPGGNVGAPINTGASVQTKIGTATQLADICVDPDGTGANKKCLSTAGGSITPGGGYYTDGYCDQAVWDDRGVVSQWCDPNELVPALLNPVTRSASEPGVCIESPGDNWSSDCSCLMGGALMVTGDYYVAGIRVTKYTCKFLTN